MRRLAFLLLLAAAPAAAHQSPSGMEYDPTCCNTRDCAPVPEHAVKERADGSGWDIFIRPGEHPLVKDEPMRDFIARNDTNKIRHSKDWEWHVCIPYKSARCLYVKSATF